ncbi:hypothetical protein Vafri_20727 [Volvox africanus]|uniref:Inosine/uridine-preferring nucleoside hydrolase domain-containing protein n=1 Tax=Volvox africanus TaxID=51714 RepID=A0A8J4BXI0_9CHLO|nr:hypothetical protein Vafri_20727 [Volvox africanus]
MAILMAANSPEVQLLGITTVYGNVPTALATQNALRLLEMTGLSEGVIVAQGAARSLKAGTDMERIADFVHGADGFGDIGLPLPKVRTRERCCLILLRVHMKPIHQPPLSPTTTDTNHQPPTILRSLTKLHLHGHSLVLPSPERPGREFFSSPVNTTSPRNPMACSWAQEHISCVRVCMYVCVRVCVCVYVCVFPLGPLPASLPVPSRAITPVTTRQPSSSSVQSTHTLARSPFWLWRR